jgi:hypothetical protein
VKSKLPYLLGFCFLFFNLSVHAQWVQDTYNFQEIWDIGWAIDACDNNTALIALGKDAAPILLSTTNGGTSWKEISLPTNVSYSGIVDISMIDILHIWYCTDNGKIYAT